MKISRQKKNHKLLQFYCNNFGFRKPYQVLVDGTICQNALKYRVNVENQFKKYLGENDVKLLTTECNIIEVDNLGPSFRGAGFIIKQYPIHRCGHSKNPITGSHCILHMVSDNNPSRYVVATQDRELQAKCRELIGVPLLYFHDHIPTLEVPSEVSKQAANEKSSAQFQISEYEKKRLSSLDDTPKIVNGLQKRRKRKGGPNPLSCKKKKRKVIQEENSNPKKKDKNKTRKRKRDRFVQKVKKELMSST